MSASKIESGRIYWGGKPGYEKRFVHTRMVKRIQHVEHVVPADNFQLQSCALKLGGNRKCQPTVQSLIHMRPASALRPFNFRHTRCPDDLLDPEVSRRGDRFTA